MRQLREGDVLQIPLGDGVHSAGEIIAFLQGDSRAFLVVLCRGTFAASEAEARLPDILMEPPQLA